MPERWQLEHGSARSPLSLAIIAMATACASGDRGEQPMDSRIAELTEDLRLDATTEDFSRIGRVIVGSRGEIIVTLPQDAQIRIYDQRGKRTASMGRKGDAPGEFQFLGQIGFKGDSIWAMDSESRRLTYFAPDGTLLRTGFLPGNLQRTTRYDGASDFRFVIPMGVLADGSMIAAGRRRFPGSERFGGEEILYLTSEGDMRPIATSPDYNDPRWMMEVAGLGRPVPFAQFPISSIASDAGRLAFATSDITSSEGGVWNVRVLRTTGDTLFAKTFPFAGVPIPQAARDSAANAEIQAGAASEGPADLDQRFRRLALEKMPPVYAPLRTILVGLDGTTWVTLRDSANVRPVVVLDSAGEMVGRVHLTTRQTLRQARSTRLWVTELDDNDLPSIVRYRVRGISCAGCG